MSKSNQVIEIRPQESVSLHPGIFPFVDVDILENKEDGTVRRFLFTLDALCYIEATTGRTVMTDSQAWANLSIKDLRHFLYAGLRTDDPTMTLNKAGQLLGIENMAPLFAKMMESWNACMSGNPIPLEIPVAA
jgi:hypothetical protein